MKKVLSLVAVVAMLALCLVGCGGNNTEGNSDPVSKQKVKVINQPLSEEQYAFCMAKGNDDLRTKVNEYLAKIKADGTFNTICNNYFGDGTPNKFEVSKRDDSKDQLIVATSTGFAPFEMVDGGKFYGVDLEIARGLAEYLGKELVIEDMQFASVCTSVEKGLCDIGMSGLTITPARQKVLDFSDSYYSANQVLIVPAANTEFDGCATPAEVEAILKGKDASTKIGCQNGTTGAIYIKGDAEEEDGYGFEGLKATQMTYDYAALAVTAMINGEIDYVIVDDAPANAIAKSVNK